MLALPGLVSAICTRYGMAHKAGGCGYIDLKTKQFCPSESCFWGIPFVIKISAFALSFSFMYIRYEASYRPY